MLTPAIQDLFRSQLAYIAVVDADGAPTIGPKMTMRVIDERTLAFNENTAGGLLSALRGGDGRVAIAIVDREAMDGARIVGTASVHESGAEYDEGAAFAARGGSATPKFVVRVAVEDVQTLAPRAKRGGDTLVPSGE